MPPPTLKLNDFVARGLRVLAVTPRLVERLKEPFDAVFQPNDFFEVVRDFLTVVDRFFEAAFFFVALVFFAVERFLELDRFFEPVLQFQFEPPKPLALFQLKERFQPLWRALVLVVPRLATVERVRFFEPVLVRPNLVEKDAPRRFTLLVRVRALVRVRRLREPRFEVLFAMSELLGGLGRPHDDSPRPGPAARTIEGLTRCIGRTEGRLHTG